MLSEGPAQGMDWGTLDSAPRTSSAAARWARIAQWGSWGLLAVGALTAAYVRLQLRLRLEAQVLLVAGLAGFLGLAAFSAVYRETYHRLHDAGR
jgi:hypothetical protein